MQFKEARARDDATSSQRRRRIVIAQTSEAGAGARAALARSRANELLREVGAVLRMSEAEAAQLGDLPEDPDEDQTMIINMGPQHPSTHGVLRLMLELQGETVLRCKPIIGYLHTGMEKTGEQLTYLQGGTNVTRMDYLSPFFNELVFSMATEQLLGIDERHPRAGGVDPHAAVRAQPDVAATCCSSPPTAWTSARCR